MPSCSQQLCVETTASSATSATVALSLAVAATVPPAIGSIATEKASTKTIIVRIPTADLPLRPKVSCEVGHGSSQSSARRVAVPRVPVSMSVLGVIMMFHVSRFRRQQQNSHVSPDHASRPSLTNNQTITNEPTPSIHHAPKSH